MPGSGELQLPQGAIALRLGPHANSPIRTDCCIFFNFSISMIARVEPSSADVGGGRWTGVETELFSPTSAAALLCASSATSVETADQRAVFRVLTVVRSTSSQLSSQGTKFFVKIGDVLQCAAGPRLF